MSKQLKKKIISILLVIFLCLIALGSFLMVMQTNLSAAGQKEDLREKMQQLEEILASAEETEAKTTGSYDGIYRAKAESLAYMLKLDGEGNRDANGEAFPSVAQMREYAEVLNVKNVFVLGREGETLAASQSTDLTFTPARFNQLRTVFTQSGSSEPFEVEHEDHAHRLYGAKIDSAHMAVIDLDPTELRQILADTSTWEGILKNVKTGLEGYSFAVSAKDYSFLYHPDGTVTGTDALLSGIAPEVLNDGYCGWFTVNGERLYGSVKETGDAYLICAVTEQEINSSRNITVGIVLFIFFIVVTVIAAYAILTMLRSELAGENAEDYKELPGGFCFNRVIAGKIVTMSVIGLICILTVSFYMQTLFALSRQSMSNEQRVTEVEDTISRHEKEVGLLTARYNRDYESKAKTAAYILEKHPELADVRALSGLSAALGVEYIYLFNEAGELYATDSGYTNFVLSENPEDQSYEFRKLLQGVPVIVQEAQPDEISGEYRQYIGVSVSDEAGHNRGFVQISVKPELLKDAVSSLDLSAVLDGIRVGTNGFAFAVDKTGTILYYPEEKYIGRNALEYGLAEKALIDGYSDYLKLFNRRYYAASTECGDSIIYVAVPEKDLEQSRVPIALATAGVSFLCLLVIGLILSVHKKSTEAEESAGEAQGSGMIEVRMPDGSLKKTESAANRWSNASVKWTRKTPEQQVLGILSGLLTLLAVLICLSVLFKDQMFAENSVLLYVLEGSWERSVNLFAITACIMIICVISVASMILRRILKLLSRTFDARGETICRLLSSLLKYVSLIAMLYFCFAMFGVDTKTLLASAGILSLVIGLGAQQLVADILAGLFIIFEGEFRVGDIVTIGDWRGTVMEIGVRTTKVKGAGENIKIISNSAISGVINMTKQYSMAFCDVGIEYGESLERVENILQKEFPLIKSRLDSIVDGPFYNGVVSLGDNSVNIRISAQCREEDRIQLERDLNRQMKILFDAYDINIPFPQVVLNQPTVFKEATLREKQQAEAFNEEQKDLTKELNERLQ